MKKIVDSGIVKTCDELDRFGGNHTIHEQDQKDSRFGM